MTFKFTLYTVFSFMFAHLHKLLPLFPVFLVIYKEKKTIALYCIHHSMFNNKSSQLMTDLLKHSSFYENKYSVSVCVNVNTRV